MAHLTFDQREKLKNLVFSFKNMFPDVPNKTTAACHDIDFGDAAPIKQHPYRLNPLKREVMRNEIQYMLDNDIIEPSNSEWSSSSLLVPKYDNTFCLVTDIRKVNSVTKSDTYPIPRIEYCIDMVGHAKFVSNFISHNLAFQRIEPIWMLLYWSSTRNINIMTSSSCFAWHIRKTILKRKYQIL
jgi:hypothetical protein